MAIGSPIRPRPTNSTASGGVITSVRHATQGAELQLGEERQLVVHGPLLDYLTVDDVKMRHPHYEQAVSRGRA